MIGFVASISPPWKGGVGGGSRPGDTEAAYLAATRIAGIDPPPAPPFQGGEQDGFKWAAARAPHGSNQPPKIIYKKIYIEGHGGHHGGAWKVAYADFVTAMKAFFLLLWILGATTEKQRKSIADYFAPTLVELKQNSAGSNGIFGGSSITDKDNYPNRAHRRARGR